jgi:hypothetical protein
MKSGLSACTLEISVLLTIKLTGSNLAQRNCRTVPRLDYVFSFVFDEIYYLQLLVQHNNSLIKLLLAKDV